MHSYGVVQAYAMGVPLLAPSPKLLSKWHAAFGLVGHKGPGNVRIMPWRGAHSQPAPMQQPPSLAAASVHTCTLCPFFSPWRVACAHCTRTAPVRVCVQQVPWRRSTERRRVPNDAFGWLTHDYRSWWTPDRPPAGGSDTDGCPFDPNDGCSEEASMAWLKFAEPYTWPHVRVWTT